MRAIVTPSSLHGAIKAVASKSMAHRMLILNALAAEPGNLVCNTTSQDIEATERCLRALVPALEATGDGTDLATLDCGESGSTLRFLLPVVCALGASARFVCRGRLSERPLAPLDEQLRQHGAHVRKTDDVWEASGRIRGGRFVLPGDVSSQYVSGLLLASPLLDEECEILVERPVQSRPYVELTIRALSEFGSIVDVDKVEVDGKEFERFRAYPTRLAAERDVVVEGDWSNAAFWLAEGSMEREGLTVTGLDLASPQGDRAILAALSAFGARIARKGDAARATADRARAASFDAGAIPDLVPPLAAVAATAPGTSVLHNAGRLRLKESDRLSSICDAIGALGGNAHVEGDALVIDGVDALRGGVVDAANDHRIAMMAAIMATHASAPTTVLDAGCVSKSYPTFWKDFNQLGGLVQLVDD